MATAVTRVDRFRSSRVGVIALAELVNEPWTLLPFDIPA